MASSKVANDLKTKYGQAANAPFPSGTNEVPTPTSTEKTSMTSFGRMNHVLKVFVRSGYKLANKAAVTIRTAKESLHAVITRKSGKEQSSEGTSLTAGEENEQDHGVPGFDELEETQEVVNEATAIQAAVELNPKLGQIKKLNANIVEGQGRSNRSSKTSFRQSGYRSRSQSRDNGGHSDVANAATVKVEKGQGKGGKGQDQAKCCFKCGKPGHKGSKCPEKSQSANTAQAQAEEPYRPSEELLAKIKAVNETLDIARFVGNAQARIETVSKASLDVKAVTWYYENEYEPSV
jgi:hypothetical protein